MDSANTAHNKLSWKGCVCLLVIIAVLPVMSCDFRPIPPAQDFGSKVELALVSLPSDDRVVVQVLLENTSESTITVPNLQPGYIERYGSWGGWSVYLDGPTGKFSYPTMRVPLESNDFVELEPRRRINVTVDLSRARRYEPRYVEEPAELVSSVPGEYVAYASLSIRHPASIGRVPKDMWTGTARSNPLEILIPATDADAQ